MLGEEDKGKQKGRIEGAGETPKVSRGQRVKENEWDGGGGSSGE